MTARSQLSGVFSTPNLHMLCVVAGGRCVLGDVRNLESFKEVQITQVRQVLSSVESQVLLLAGLTKIAAIGADGVRWITDRVALDWITLLETQSNALKFSHWYPDTDVVSTLDLNTGQVIDGHFDF